MNSIRLDIEMYRNEDGTYGMWIADNMGGSGIEVEEATPEACAKKAAPYLEDYLCQL